MNIKMLKAAFIGFTLSVSCLANATLILGTSGSAIYYPSNAASSSNFDRIEFLFASEYVDTITLANFSSGALFHDHGSAQAAVIEILTTSGWMNIFSSAISNNVNISILSLYASPVIFTGTMVTGIRMDVSQHTQVSAAYHGLGTSWTINTSGTQVPEPSTLAIFALGILGLASRRYNKQP
ncbi:PEP-CTERM sorting domain-containing protein [Colwellia psychrerythraea]|uniref:PEP motif putative anchor domain protein n=1 Tax=Colwellia psychrerythraea TaxID=28229 RepID=A0A099L175_COLPS|nr:PEP-CTERM sorting domain-containing protein [Colwellia psychrerythraea]KGJ96190.1 PEP motif putative anchor domain protein [Colwellia psychrerythraea]